MTIDPYLPSAEFWTGTSPGQATGRVTSQPVRRDTGTSSAQTAGCGQKSSKGYRLKQDYWLHRVAGDIQQGYCLPAPECCRFRSVNRFLSVAGPGALLVTEESVVPASNPVLTTGLPVPECCRLRNRSAAGYKKSAVPILTGKEPSSNPVLTSGSTVTEVSARCCPNSLVAEPSPRAYRFNRLQSC